MTKGFVLDTEARDELVGRDARSADFIHPFLGGKELLHDLAIDRWVIDLPHDDLLDAERDAPTLIEHLRREVLPIRQQAARKEEQQNAERRAADPAARQDLARIKFLDTWWLHWRRRADLLEAIAPLSRYIATSRVASEQRAPVFAFVNTAVRPGDSLTVFALDDPYSLGILSSELHRRWFDARCSRLKADPRYTSTTVFDSFPWPQAPSPEHVETISGIVDELLDLRAKNLAAGMSLAAQYDTLRQPGKSRLRILHAALDAAVLAAYGFSSDDDVLAQLLALNLDMAAEPQHARGPGPAL